MRDGQGSTGNVLAAICSLFVPELGQLVLARLLKAITIFVLAGPSVVDPRRGPVPADTLTGSAHARMA